VRVTTFDVTGDGVADTIVVVQGPSGKTGQIRSFNINSVSPFSVTQAPTMGGYSGPYFTASINSVLPTLMPGSSPLQLAATTSRPNTTTSLLTQSALQPIVQEAIARWSATGLAPAIVERMKQVQFAVADLSGQYLGAANGGTIYLDRDAAGFGWFVDPTPSEDEEFGQRTANSTVSSRIDLLTAIAHELGHVAGLGDLDDVADSLMDGRLELGTRRAPTSREVDALFAAGVFG
jgi:hypothetical protein